MRRRNIKNAHERLLQAEGIIILNPTEYRARWHQFFQNNHPIYIEIGMGKGDFLVEHALRNPDINYIGIEKFESVIIQAIKKVQSSGADNIRLICWDALAIEDLFGEMEVAQIYLNFSDPWPKNKHAKRRLTDQGFLEKYKKILIPNGLLEFKTDNRALFEYSLISLNQNKWDYLDINLNLHENVAEETIVMTEYEKKFHARGQIIYYIKVSAK